MRHKWFVFVAGRKVGDVALWRLLIHDYTKFSPTEWSPYVHKFYNGTTTIHDPQEFHVAWTHHWHNNPHHHQYWLRINSHGELEALEMPYKFVREMVADWMGAGRAQKGHWDVSGWYGNNKQHMQLHTKTRAYVELLLQTVEV
jgi:hypothetical protein